MNGISDISIFLILNRSRPHMEDKQIDPSNMAVPRSLPPIKVSIGHIFLLRALMKVVWFRICFITWL